LLTPENARIGVIGLGYVGLPLAAAFGSRRSVIGFDIKSQRIEELRGGHDSTLEVSEEELSRAEGLRVTDEFADLADCNVYIVTVPTPLDEHQRPDLTPLLRSSETVGRVICPDNVVVYESTVYPGATEEDCVPVLERESDLKLNQDFFVGYSPERINPGDRNHRLENIVKVTSGSTPEAADFVDALYQEVVTAGTHKASCIRVAEAAKVIENIQRDVNIALINELAILFNRLGIDTQEVLEAAGSKWNFLPFRPGLVGGHCIGIDPYYLTHKAQEVGHHPELILAGRRLNDGMGKYVAGRLVKAMMQRGTRMQGARVLVMGLTFKEDTPDLRNSRSVDVIQELEDYGLSVDAYDPWVQPQESLRELGKTPIATPEPNAYDGIVLAVGHRQFAEMGVDGIRSLGREPHVLYDLKHVLPQNAIDLRL
jgi:UDP-N-acetyl-D-galactosamine dehydrogenase